MFNDIPECPNGYVINWQQPLERPALLLTSAMTKDLIADAEGGTSDPETKNALDRWFFDYADRDLEDEYIDVADDLKALMGHDMNVAMLVVEKTEEKRLHRRICDYAHDWLDGDEDAEIKHMHESNAQLAVLVEKLQTLKLDVEAAFRTLEDEPLSLELLTIIKRFQLRLIT